MSAQTTTQAVPAGTYKVDPVHSTINFAVVYNGVTTFRSGFRAYEATLTGGEAPKLEGSVEVAGIDIDEEAFKGHLLSPDFFDAERYPEVSFTADEVRRDGDRVEFDGEITIRGISQPATLTGTVNGPAVDHFGKNRVGLSLETTVDRTQFGITWNMPLPNGEPALANEVTLKADLTLVGQ